MISIDVVDSLITSGNISSTAGLHLTLNNVMFKGIISDSASHSPENLVKATKANIMLNNVTLTGNYNSKTFLTCESCQINGSVVRLIDLQIKHGFRLVLSSASVDMLDIFDITINMDLIFALHCNLSIYRFHAVSLNTELYVFILANTVTEIGEMKLWNGNYDYILVELYQAATLSVNTLLVSKSTFGALISFRDPRSIVWISNLIFTENWCVSLADTVCPDLLYTLFTLL